jgi:ubiquinone/menaquinone biosynthesis C-methylase UbiE
MTMQAFCSSQRCSYSLVTSFSCLHWVPNQPAAVHFFNRILKKGNRSFLSYFSQLINNELIVTNTNHVIL